ncbi:Histidine biosynthesis bifunctional protein HisB [uncultured archaeon]|nr:Histidine biosynthesis bifunctional protein HisB [uncultured archaeon]
MTTLVCLDRDGTINKDEDYFLGSSLNWKQQVKILEGVVDGIKLLNNISDLEIFIITNQSGVALKGSKFELLNEKRMHEVNEYIINLLERQGAKIRGYFSCPYVDNKYLEKAKKIGREINPDYIKDKHPDLKPNIGMIIKAAETIEKKIEECNIYNIGDRYTDVEMGLKAGGTGILVPGKKTRELGDEARVKEIQEIYKQRVYIAKDFLDAATYITNKLLSLS